MIVGQKMRYNFVMFFVKLFLFILYFHFFGVSRRIKILIYVDIESIFMIYTKITIVHEIFCFFKLENNWFEIIAHSKCFTYNRIMICIINDFGIINDFYIFDLSIFMILRLQLSRKKKIEVCVLFINEFL